MGFKILGKNVSHSDFATLNNYLSTSAAAQRADYNNDTSNITREDLFRILDTNKNGQICDDITISNPKVGISGQSNVKAILAKHGFAGCTSEIPSFPRSTNTPRTPLGNSKGIDKGEVLSRAEIDEVVKRSNFRELIKSISQLWPSSRGLPFPSSPEVKTTPEQRIMSDGIKLFGKNFHLETLQDLRSSIANEIAGRILNSEQPDQLYDTISQELTRAELKSDQPHPLYDLIAKKETEYKDEVKKVISSLNNKDLLDASFLSGSRQPSLLDEIKSKVWELPIRRQNIFNGYTSDFAAKVLESRFEDGDVTDDDIQYLWAQIKPQKISEHISFWRAVSRAGYGGLDHFYHKQSRFKGLVEKLQDLWKKEPIHSQE